MGPLLWNATFDAVLKTEQPTGAQLLGFADDTMLVTRAKSMQELETVTNEALSLLEQRISDLGLQIAVEKTEAVLFKDHAERGRTPRGATSAAVVGGTLRAAVRSP